MTMPETNAIEPMPEGCSECGSTTWTISVVNDQQERVCIDCLSGLTALRKHGAAA